MIGCYVAYTTRRAQSSGKTASSPSRSNQTLSTTPTRRRSRRSSLNRRRQLIRRRLPSTRTLIRRRIRCRRPGSPPPLGQITWCRRRRRRSSRAKEKYKANLSGATWTWRKPLNFLLITSMPPLWTAPLPLPRCPLLVPGTFSCSCKGPSKLDRALSQSYGLDCLRFLLSGLGWAQEHARCEGVVRPK